MNKEQKEIATEIIFFIKENGNKVFKNDLLKRFDFNETERTFILSTLKEEYGLINVKGSLFSLSKKGFDFTSFNDLELKEKLEFKKLQADLSLTEKTLKEFPKTKWFARFGFFIAAILAIVQLIQWIMQLQSQ